MAHLHWDEPGKTSLKIVLAGSDVMMWKKVTLEVFLCIDKNNVNAFGMKADMGMIQTSDLIGKRWRISIIES